MKTKISTALILSAILMACGSQGNQEAATEQREPEKPGIERIAELEELLPTQSDMKLARITAKNLVLNYQSFVQENPDDAKCPLMLIKAADLKNSDLLGWYDEAAEMYADVHQSYPNFEDRTYAMYMHAAVLDHQLGKKDEAEIAYKALIEAFPEDDWSEQARQRLTTLHMTDEEFIEMAKQKNDV